MTTLTLQQTLDRVIAKHGEDTPFVQMLRDQIASTDKSVEDLYVTGSVRPVNASDIT